jgi:hypothetical protein
MSLRASAWSCPSTPHLLMDDYTPERERQIQTGQERYERSMHCGIDPHEVEERLRRDMLAWLRKQEEAREKAA